LVMSFDGFLYAINGKSGCAHAVDIGENSYSAVLVDDVCGDGNLELLVSTMNGNVYMLQTQAPYHPLKTWSSQVSCQACCLGCILSVNSCAVFSNHVGVRCYHIACRCTCTWRLGFDSSNRLCSEWHDRKVMVLFVCVTSECCCVLLCAGPGSEWVGGSLEPPWVCCNTNITAAPGCGRPTAAGGYYVLT
jgi:hypothetical protein